MKDDLVFVMIYIDEAHALDGWQLGRHVEIKNHKSISDRCAAACLTRDRFNLRIPILLDTMDNAFDRTYAVWPERYFVIRGRSLAYRSEPTDEFGFNREKFLEDLQRIARDVGNDRLQRQQKSLQPSQ